MLASQPRRGSALIEVLIALVLLAIAGTGLVTLLGQTGHSMRSTLEAERTTRRAAAELDRLSLLDGHELLALVGQRQSHGWAIDITASAPGLFDVRIAESDTSAALLQTTLYRPRSDSSNATP
jgi:Tfp pilus assembly protein PilV